MTNKLTIRLEACHGMVFIKASLAIRNKLNVFRCDIFTIAESVFRGGVKFISEHTNNTHSFGINTDTIEKR